jgi:DNA-binding SARP family transcriptional activator
MNTVWRICLLGGLRAERAEETITRFRSQKIGALLAYLALFPQRSHTREELADLLWPDAEPEVARTNLRTASWSHRE